MPDDVPRITGLNSAERADGRPTADAHREFSIDPRAVPAVLESAFELVEALERIVISTESARALVHDLADRVDRSGSASFRDYVVASDGRRMAFMDQLEMLEHDVRRLIREVGAGIPALTAEPPPARRAAGSDVPRKRRGGADPDGLERHLRRVDAWAERTQFSARVRAAIAAEELASLLDVPGNDANLELSTRLVRFACWLVARR